MSIGSKVVVVASRRSYCENGATGVIVGEDGQCWLVEFDGVLMDYLPDEIEEVIDATV